MRTMYNRKIINDLVSFIGRYDGIVDKQLLIEHVRSKFLLTKDRSVLYCRDFAIRFCKSKQRSFENTVLALSALQKYDSVPFIVCLVTPEKNYLMLANTTFLRKISHSSQELRVNNIKGSFNGSDIMRYFEGFENEPNNFEFLFSSHENYTFEENLERLVETTNNIHPTGKRFEPNTQQLSCIMRSVERTCDFFKSKDYDALTNELGERVRSVTNEIAIATLIDNVNLRGRIIEYLITSKDSLRDTLINALRTGAPLPQIYTADKLGDYKFISKDFYTETDIKTKVLFLSSNPKGYNIDKLLSFLSNEKSVYLVYVIAIDENKKIHTQLCSLFHRQLLNGTRIIKHWAGRNSRGVTQYDGSALEEIVFSFENSIDCIDAKEFIVRCIEA